MSLSVDTKALDGMRLEILGVVFQGKQGEQGARGLRGLPGQSVYDLWLEQGNTGTPEEFLELYRGPAGRDGTSLTNEGEWGIGFYQPNSYVFAQGSTTNRAIWFLRGNEEYQSLVEPRLDEDHWQEFVGVAGEDGTDGREVELQSTATHIQWRYAGQPVWTNLVSKDDLRGAKGDKGDDGEDGTDGTDGTNGTDGEPAEFRFADGYLQWKLLSSPTWINLIAESALKGPPGDSGATKRTIKILNTAGYTLEAADSLKYVIFGTGDAAKTLTIGTDASVEGNEYIIDNSGNNGIVTLTAANGAALLSPMGLTLNQNEVARITCVGSLTYRVVITNRAIPAATTAPVLITSTATALTNQAAGGTTINIGDYVRMTSTAAKTITVNNTSAALGAEWHYDNDGATGDATFVGASGVTVVPVVGGTLVLAPGGVATLKKLANNRFRLVGSTKAA